MGYETSQYRLVDGLARSRSQCQRQTTDEPLRLESEQPRRSRQGSRVSQEYLKKVKAEFRFPRVGKPSLLHIAYSFYFGEPGGTSLELEYYEPEAVNASAVYGSHWQRPHATEKFAGKGYVCQGLSHGTLECDEG